MKPSILKKGDKVRFPKSPVPDWILTFDTYSPGVRGRYSGRYYFRDHDNGQHGFSCSFVTHNCETVPS